MKDKNEIRQELQSQGFASAGVWGGPKAVRYYAPDGSVRDSIPSHLTDREGNKYDRMILQGYSLTPPENPKLHCDGCGKWHDTIEEVKSCVKLKKAEAVKWERKASQLLNKGSDVKKLQDEVSELKNLVKQLLEKK